MKAVIFDMDGVIIDSEPLHFEVEKKLLEDLGGVFDLDFHNGLVGSNDELMWSTFKEMFDFKHSLEEIVALKKERFLSEVHRIPLVKDFDGLLSMLDNNNILMGLASSNNRMSVDAIIRIFELDRYLNFSISGDEVSRGKPDPEIFLKAAEKLSLSPQDCLVIEDARNGVIAAKSAGMKCIGYINPNSGNQDLSQADLIIHSYNELSMDVLRDLFL